MLQKINFFSGFQLYAIRTGIRAYMDATPLIVSCAPVLNSELNVFREVLLTHQSDDVDSEKGDAEGDGYHYGDGDDDDDELDFNDEENVSSNGRNNEVDFVVTALQKLTVDSLEPVLAEEAQPGVSCWLSQVK